MGFLFDNLEFAISMLGSELKDRVKDKVKNYSKSYNSSYGSSSEHYSNLSDSQLERELQHLRDMNGYDANRMARIKALKDELDSRQ